MLLLILTIACNAEPAAPLPAPEPVAEVVSLRRVKVPGVEAMIARSMPEGGAGEGTLLLVDALDEAAAEQARAAAAGGRVALAVAPEVAEDRARAYLEGIPGVKRPTRTRCLRASCLERDP